jgi:hypothetical protein
MSIRDIKEATKKKIAGKQFYRCANKPDITLYNLENYNCPMWSLYNGSFDESGYDIDHIIEFSISQNNMEDNLQALCVSCHRVKTRNFAGCKKQYIGQVKEQVKKCKKNKKTENMKEYQKIYREQCKNKMKEYQKMYREKNKEKRNISVFFGKKKGIPIREFFGGK